MKIRLTLDEQQARSIKKALDLFSRILGGNIEALESTFRHFLFLKPTETYGKVQMNEVERLIEKLKGVTFPQYSYHSYPGILSEEIHDETRVMLDLIEVLEHVLYDPNRDSSLHRGRFEPYHWSQQCPLAVAEKVEEQVEDQ